MGIKLPIGPAMPPDASLGPRRGRNNAPLVASPARAKRPIMTAAALKAEDRAPVRLAGATRAELTRALAEIRCA